MKAVCITSTTDFAGKNLLLVGLGHRLKKDGYELGLFKPLGNKPFRNERLLTDADIVFFHQSLGLKPEGELNCPIVVIESLVEKGLVPANRERMKKELHLKVVKSFESLSRGKDIVLVKGLGKLYRGSMFGLTEINLIKEFNWPTIVMDKFTNLGETVDGFISAKKALGNLLAGVVFNNVPPARLKDVKSRAVPYLKNEEIEVLGIIPEERSLEAISISEIRDNLEGDLILGKDQVSERVERFCMGVANVESSVSFFRQEKCQAVVTSGDRTDILLAALETPLKCLILTDKRYPNDIILSRAEELKVPVIVVPYDLVRTMQKLDSLSRHIGLSTPSKVKEVVRVVTQEVNIKTIYKRLGI